MTLVSTGTMNMFIPALSHIHFTFSTKKKLFTLHPAQPVSFPYQFKKNLLKKFLDSVNKLLY